jgi:hypothetical protein
MKQDWASAELELSGEAVRQIESLAG